jgi:hypothetical protein
LVDAKWIHSWLNFVEGKDYFSHKKGDFDPPGPMNNVEIEQWVTSLDTH